MAPWDDRVDGGNIKKEPYAQETESQEVVGERDLTDVSVPDFHDSQFVELLMKQGGDLDIMLDNVVVYARRASEPEVCDVWSYQATLKLFEVSDLSVKGASIGEVDPILDASLKPPVREWAVKPRLNLEHIILQMQSGRFIEASCSAATLELRSKVRELGPWRGPL